MTVASIFDPTKTGLSFVLTLALLFVTVFFALRAWFAIKDDKDE